MHKKKRNGKITIITTDDIYTKKNKRKDENTISTISFQCFLLLTSHIPEQSMLLYYYYFICQ